MGAWIEIIKKHHSVFISHVASRVGAWIEIIVWWEPEVIKSVGSVRKLGSLSNDVGE